MVEVEPRDASVAVPRYRGGLQVSSATPPGQCAAEHQEELEAEVCRNAERRRECSVYCVQLSCLVAAGRDDLDVVSNIAV